jgi:predicted O-methyltransferase YrrM
MSWDRTQPTLTGADPPMNDSQPRFKTIDAIGLTKSHPRLLTFARRIRAAITGKPYGFNRQKMRVRAFHAITLAVRFDNFIETGSHIGKTTLFLTAIAKRHRAKVYSCEINDEYFEIAKATTRGAKNLQLHHEDSVKFLSKLGPIVRKEFNFIYLDAHWYDYLPLKDELSIISTWPNSIVMIDDFKVPFDDGFGWDRYDDDREICMRYIEGAVAGKPIFFPAYGAASEGTVARGYCVIAMSGDMGALLEKIELLKRFSENV